MSANEWRANARIRTANGVDYATVETAQEILEELHEATPAPFLTLMTVTGQMFPPEALHILRKEIVSVQEMSEVAWVWFKHANEMHYARMLNETPAEQMAAAQERLVEALSGDE